MTRSRRWLALVEACAPPEIGSNLAGDLLEEAEEVAALYGRWRARRWLARQSTVCCLHGLRLRSRQWDLLECASATALLFALPVGLIVALRRYALTLVPYRDSSEWSAGPYAACILAVMALSAIESRLVAVRARMLPPLACAVAALLVSQGSWTERVVLAVAALAGGAITKLMQRRGVE